MANELVTKSYDIDISKTGARPIVRLSQYDTRTVRVLFTVYDGTELQVIDGCTARVDGKRSDGTAFTKPCDIEAGSKVAFTVEAEMTNSAGKHEAELVIINSDGNPLGTQNFTLSVEKAPFERESAATVEDRTLYDQYTTAVDTRVTAAIKKADDAVTADTGKVDKLVSDTQARIDAIVSESVTPIERGGTGATTVAAARNALGLGNTSGALPIANGGTGATTVAAARNALGLNDTGWVAIGSSIHFRRVGCVVTVAITYEAGGAYTPGIGNIPESIIPNTERPVDFVISKYTGDDSKRYAALARVGVDGGITILGGMASGDVFSGTFTYVVGF